MGPRDYTYREFTGIIGKLSVTLICPMYKFPLEQVKQTFLNNGFSEDFVDNLIEMELRSKPAS